MSKFKSCLLTPFAPRIMTSKIKRRRRLTNKINEKAQQKMKEFEDKIKERIQQKKPAKTTK